MAFLQVRQAFFRRLASSEFHQMLSFLRSDFHTGQEASYDLVMTEWTLFASTPMSSFEKGTGGKIRSFNFCLNSFAYLFQHVRRTLRNIWAWFWILLLTWNLIYMWSENDGTLLICQSITRSHAYRFTKVKSRTSSRVLVLNVGLLPTLQKFKSCWFITQADPLLNGLYWRIPI